jgi:tetratricopeptide (TPR) repeat protein
MSRVQSEVERIRGLVERREYLEALAACEILLADAPENRDVLYLAAVNQRYLGRIADALRTLLRFESLHPGYGRLYQERGHCYRSVGEAGAAMAAYRRAVALNPTLRASWMALDGLQRSAGLFSEAETAAASVRKLANLPRPVVTASNMFYEDDPYGAETVVREFLKSHPDHIEAMRLLAQIGMKLDVLDDAEFLLESVLVFAPDYRAARHDYATVLSQLHKHSQAREELRKLLKVDPANSAYRATYAYVCVGLGNHDEALKVYRELAAENPERADIQLSIAHAQKTLGEQAEAITSYRAAAALRPSYGDAYWSLANLKTYRFTDEEIAMMRTQLAAPELDLIDRYHLCFALGKALEDGRQYAEAFGCYERGNLIKKNESRYRPEHMERNTKLQKAICTRELFAARRNAGCPRADPIFIVGLPRAGSTLLEQILASHSQVEGTMELADITRLVHHLQGCARDDSNPRYPGILAELRPEDLRRLGEKYIDDTQIFRSGKPGGAAFFVDKMPNNFRHIGLIHLILPNAKIIDARREPMACCFSNFKQLFATGQEFTYSLDDIARYYRTYVELMEHWNAVLPGKILRVQYEDVVMDLEGHVRRILDFCGLELEANCVEFYKTGRSVRTASSEQVRRPIYKESLDEWRHFEPWLGALRDSLGDLARH